MLTVRDKLLVVPLSIFVALGAATLLLLCGQQWTAAVIASSALLLFLVVYAAYYHPGLVLLVCFLINFSIIPFKTISFFIFAVLCAVSAWKRYREGALQTRLDTVTVLWAVVLLLLAATLPRWSDTKGAIKGSIEIALMPLMMYKLVNDGWIREISLRDVLTKYIPINIAFILVQVIYAMLFSHELSSVGTDINVLAFHSLDLIWGRSNYIAAILVFHFLLYFAQKKYYPQKFLHQAVANTLLLGTLLVIILILSRGATLSLLLGAATLIGLTIVYDRKINVWQWVLMGLVAVPVMYKYISAMIYRFSIAKVDSPTLSRLIIWKESIGMIWRNPLVGMGPLQYKFSLPIQGGNDPHNIFLRYGLDLGGMAMLVILAILAVPVIKAMILMRRQVRVRNVVMVFLPAYIAAVFNSQLEVAISTYIYGMVFWFSFALFCYNLDHLDGGDNGLIVPSIDMVPAHRS